MATNPLITTSIDAILKGVEASLDSDSHSPVYPIRVMQSRAALVVVQNMIASGRMVDGLGGTTAAQALSALDAAISRGTRTAADPKDVTSDHVAKVNRVYGALEARAKVLQERLNKF